MSPKQRYWDNLPQTTQDLFLTDGGLETTLIFKDGFDSPEFAAFPLMAAVRRRLAPQRLIQIGD